MMEIQLQRQADILRHCPRAALLGNDPRAYRRRLSEAEGGWALRAEGQATGPKHRTFIYVNNRLEGNAISTIAAMLEPG
jgi:hypothetical protein